MENSERSISPLLILTLLFVPPCVFFGFGLPEPEVLSIFTTIIGLWLTEALPPPVTGLLVPVLAGLYGVLSPPQAFQPFGSDILFFFLGCFLMSRSMEKHGLDRRLAYFIIGRCIPGHSFFAINFILASTAFFLSMWISNTSATAILTSITLGILSSLDSEISDAKIKHRMTVRLLLTCAFAASIGGLATPVGSPPNLIALKLLSQNGIEISFIEWVAVALPLAVCMLGALLLIFELIYPLKKLTFPNAKSHFSVKLKELGAMSTGETQIAFIFSVAVILWIAPGILVTVFPDNAMIGTLNTRLSMSMVGLLCGLATFLLPIKHGKIFEPNLSWSETTKVDWGTLMLFGGGLTLGLILEQSGAAQSFGNYLFGGNLGHLLFVAALVVTLSIIMSEFASNTAAASILIPLIIASTLTQGATEHVTLVIVLAATFGASFGFMLPVSTPPNAIVYGTGKVPAKEMRRAGVVFDLIGALLILGYVSVML